MKKKIFLLAGIGVILAGGITAYVLTRPAGTHIQSDVGIWLTTTNQKNLLTPQPSVTPVKVSREKNPADALVIQVDPAKTFQEMDGFGASFTDASAWLVSNVLDEQARTQLMTNLFDPSKGIGMSFLRQPMGATDFARNMYTYDDMPQGEQDMSMEHFTIAHDKEYIIPRLLEARQLNPQLKIMASPWSPPAWMKTSDNLIGGMLRGDAYDAFAKYFVSFIKAYQAEGLPIYAVSPQNEPLYSPSEYPGMKMQPYEQANFIKDHLGPQFEKNQLDTKILVYDHNWDNPIYPEIVFQQAGKYVAGAAWHCYGGTHDAMTKVYNKFPDKGVWFTEASGGQWVPPFHDAFADQMMHIIRATRNYAKTVVWWNIALDEKNGPTLLKNSTCRGLVKIDTTTREITYNVDYYTMGHISKFVKPGALRIESGNYHDTLETTAFKNPDGSIVLIAHNRTVKDHVLTIRYGSSEFQYKLTGKAAATFQWNTGNKK